MGKLAVCILDLDETTKQGEMYFQQIMLKLVHPLCPLFVCFGLFVLCRPCCYQLFQSTWYDFVNFTTHQEVF